MSSSRRAFISGARMQGLLVLLAIGLVLSAIGIGAAMRADQAAIPYGARVYVDAYHCARHPPDRDNVRHHHAYHTVSGTRRWMDELRRVGAEVHVETTHGFDAEALDGFDVVVLGEPSYEARFMTDRERAVLLAWVEGGGGLLAFASPPDPEVSADAFDRVFGDLGVRAPRASGEVAPVQAKGHAPVTRVQSTPAPGAPGAPEDPGTGHPVMAGVEQHLVRAGTGLDTDHAIAWVRADAGAEGAGGASVAAFEYGRGRVVVLGDVDALTNPMLYAGDHLRLAHNAVAWLAPARGDPMLYWTLAGLGLVLAVGRALFGRGGRRAGAGIVLAGGVFVATTWVWGRGTNPRTLDVSDVLVDTGNGSTIDIGSEAPGGYFSLYTHWGKDRSIRAWASERPIAPGYDALVLAGPTLPYSPEQLAVIDSYAARGGTVVYLASGRSLRSEAGEQLRAHFGVEVELGEPVLRERTPYLARGPRDVLDGVFRVYASPRAVPVRAAHGLDPLVHLSPGGWHVDDRMWTRHNCVYDLVSESRAGAFGTFMLVAPAETFDNRSVGGAYKVGDEVVQQTIDLSIRLLQRAVGRDPFASVI